MVVPSYLPIFFFFNLLLFLSLVFFSFNIVRPPWPSVVKKEIQKFEFVNDFKDRFSVLASLLSLHVLSKTVCHKLNVLLEEIQLYCLKINLK